MKVVKNKKPRVKRVEIKDIPRGEGFRYLNGEDRNVYISFGPVWATANRLQWKNGNLTKPVEYDERIIAGLVSEGALFKVTPTTKVVPVEAEIQTYE